MAMTVESREPGFVRRVLAAIVLLGLLVGAPAVVLSRLGAPWPTAEQVAQWRRTGRVETDTVIRMGLLAVGVLWAWFVLTVVDEVVRGARRRVHEAAAPPSDDVDGGDPDDIIHREATSWIRRLVQIVLATGAVGAVAVAAPSLLSDPGNAPTRGSTVPSVESESPTTTTSLSRVELTPTTLLPRADVGAATAPRPPWAALAIGGATAVGVAAAIGRHRRRALRASVPGDVAAPPDDTLVGWETEIRRLARGEDLARLDWALRAATPSLLAARSVPLVVLVEHDGGISMHVSTPCTPPAGPWHLDPRTGWWRVGAGVPLTDLAAAAGATPFVHPTLVQVAVVGDHAPTRVMLHLEQIRHLDVVGEGADDVARGVALGLATSDHLGGGHVITVDLAAVPTWPAALRRLDTTETVIDEIRTSISTADDTLALAQRRLDSPDADEWETWTVFGPHGTLGPELAPLLASGASVVVAHERAIQPHGRDTEWRLVLDGDDALLEPIGLACRPVRAEPATIAALEKVVTTPAVQPPRTESDDGPSCITRESVVSDLGESEPMESELAAVERTASDPGPAVPVAAVPPSSPQGPALVVRVLGPVRVEAANGTAVEFERSKALELVAWLATHRRRPTRGGARNALWEVDVRSATFHNVISDARRSLARVVAPPEGEEWIGRSQSDLLPLHSAVMCDLDFLDDAIRASHGLDDEGAVAVLTEAVRWIESTPFTGTDYLWSDAEGIASAAVLSATTAAVTLAEKCLALGDLAGVFAATGRGLAVLPGHDALVALRMEAHAAAGDRVSVRDEWERYLRVLAADHESEPPAAMSALRNRLLRAGP